MSEMSKESAEELYARYKALPESYWSRIHHEAAEAKKKLLSPCHSALDWTSLPLLDQLARFRNFRDDDYEVEMIFEAAATEIRRLQALVVAMGGEP